MPLTSDGKHRLVRLADPAAATALRLARLAGLDRRPHDPVRILAHPETVRSILVVRLDTIGDVLLTEPAIHALAGRFPHARIHLLGSPAAGALLAGSPDIAAFHAWDAPWHRAWRGGRAGWSTALAGLRPVLRALRRERFDLVLEFRGDLRDTVVARLAGGDVLASAPLRGGAGVDDLAVVVDPRQHRVRINLALAMAVGAEPAREAPRLYPPAAARARAADLLAGGHAWIGLHPGAGFASKVLPPGRFATIVREVLDRRPDARIAVVGTAGERSLVRALLGRLGEHAAAVLDLTGKLGLLETAAVLERCAVFLGNDSAPMHMAAAVGTPAVAFFGPSDPREYGPWGEGHTVIRTGLECSPCDHVHCVQAERYLCMQTVPLEPAIRAILERLAVPAGAGP